MVFPKGKEITTEMLENLQETPCQQSAEYMEKLYLASLTEKEEVGSDSESAD